MSDPKNTFSTGLPALDDALQGGLSNGSLTIISSRPGAGKSALLKHIERADPHHSALMIRGDVAKTSRATFDAIAAHQERSPGAPVIIDDVHLITMPNQDPTRQVLLEALGESARTRGFPLICSRGLARAAASDPTENEKHAGLLQVLVINPDGLCVDATFRASIGPQGTLDALELVGEVETALLLVSIASSPAESEVATHAGDLSEAYRERAT